MTRSSVLAACLHPGRGRKLLWDNETPAAQVGMRERERKRERQRETERDRDRQTGAGETETYSHSSLDSLRADKVGGGGL